MISGVILFPMLKTMFTNSRMTAERYMPILYSKRFYQMLLASLIGRNNKTRFSYIGVASICVIALIVLFMQRKKYLSLKPVSYTHLDVYKRQALMLSFRHWDRKKLILPRLGMSMLCIQELLCK